MQAAELIEWGFQGLLTGGLIYGVTVLTGLKSSIDHLNQQVAKIIEKAAWHETFMQKNELRIQQLELDLKQLYRSCSRLENQNRGGENG